MGKDEEIKILKMEVQVDKKQNFLDPGLRKVSVKPRF
jgi:hypothetical protein